jgi:hypothetical protein
VEVLDKIPGIIGYAFIKVEDGSIEEVKGSSTSPLGALVAYFASASEAISSRLSLGNINYVSLCYGASRLIVFPYDSKYVGIEVEKDKEPLEFIRKVRSTKPVVTKPKFEIPRSLSSKIQQINLLVEEFGGEDNRDHWLELLNQGLGILGGEILPYIGIIDEKLSFKDKPTEDKEDEFVQALRSVIDFLVKKGVIEMGSAQTRAKVQAVIERMK